MLYIEIWLEYILVIYVCVVVIIDLIFKEGVNSFMFDMFKCFIYKIRKNSLELKYFYDMEIKFRKWILIWMLLMFIFVMVFFVRVVGEVIVWNCNIIGLFIWFL